MDARADSHSRLERRARVHGALADEHRLAIVDALALSDRSPSDLAAELGVGSNLLAHHLLVLQRAGLVETARSSGDGRRRYVRLRRGALEGLTPETPALHPTSILFVCSANSARSPLAVALWRQRSRVPAQSAGTHPAKRVHPLAVSAGARHGLDLGGMSPRALDALDEAPGLVVTVCDEAHEELASSPGVPRLHWSVRDPAASGRRRDFDEAIATLAARIDALHHAVGAAAVA